MGTISDFLGRKSVASTSAAPLVSPSPKQLPAANGPTEQSDLTFADLGARLGEDNEALRNLLIDTERRIALLDEVKEAFRNLVEPIGAALHALEQEKTDNAGLRNVLAELRTSHETACSEGKALEKKGAELESDNHAFRRELTLVQHVASGLESNKAELTSEVGAARAEIANLKSQLAHEIADARSLAEANQILVDHANSADKRIVALQALRPKRPSALPRISHGAGAGVGRGVAREPLHQLPTNMKKSARQGLGHSEARTPHRRGERGRF